MTNSLHLNMAIEIVDLSIRKGDFPSFFVCLPEGIPFANSMEVLSAKIIELQTNHGGFSSHFSADYLFG